MGDHLLPQEYQQTNHRENPTAQMMQNMYMRQVSNESGAGSEEQIKSRRSNTDMKGADLVKVVSPRN